MRAKIITAVAAAATLGLGLAGAGTAGASAANMQCTRVSVANYFYVISNSTNYYIAGHNSNTPGSQPELKSFSGNTPNGTAAFFRCNVSGQNYFALEHMGNGTTTALSNDPGDKNRVDLDLVTSSGPNPSMWWTQAGSNPYTFKNMDTGLYLRVSNKGIGQYFPVVAGNSQTQWNQS
jgi:hypothetical protein